MPRSLIGGADRLLPIWFLIWSAIRIFQLSWDGRGWDLTFLGRDFRIYRNAAVALLNGSDPWAAADRWNGVNWHFAALPPAAQLFVPFAIIAEGVGLAVFFGLSVAVAWLALRRLKLPAWWLLFPPMTEGLLAANPQILVFGLLIVGGPLARAVAAGLKVYAIVPILARREWRGLAVTLVLVGLSIVVGVGLWSTYLGELGTISGRAVQESQGGVSAALLLDPKVFGPAIPSSGPLRLLPGVLMYGLVAGLVLLVAIRDVRAAGWIVAPLLWPAAEYHLATFAIPVATLPTYLLGLIVLAYELVAARPALVDEPPPLGLVKWIRTLMPGADPAKRTGMSPPPAS